MAISATHIQQYIRKPRPLLAQLLSSQIAYCSDCLGNAWYAAPAGSVFAWWSGPHFRQAICTFVHLCVFACEVCECAQACPNFSRCKQPESLPDTRSPLAR